MTRDASIDVEQANMASAGKPLSAAGSSSLTPNADESSLDAAVERAARRMRVRTRDGASALPAVSSMRKCPSASR